MVMAFSLMVTANAAHAGTQYNDEDTVTPAFSEAVEVLTGMGVFQGDSGSFRPASNITRAEVAAIIYRLATGDTGTDKMDLYTTRHPFTDVRSTPGTRATWATCTTPRSSRAPPPPPLTPPAT